MIPAAQNLAAILVDLTLGTIDALRGARCRLGCGERVRAGYVPLHEHVEHADGR